MELRSEWNALDTHSTQRLQSLPARRILCKVQRVKKLLSKRAPALTRSQQSLPKTTKCGAQLQSDTKAAKPSHCLHRQNATERVGKFINQARANLTTTENQIEGDNKEQRRTALKPATINMPISVKISYIHPFHTLYSASSK